MGMLMLLEYVPNVLHNVINVLEQWITVPFVNHHSKMLPHLVHQELETYQPLKPELLHSNHSLIVKNRPVLLPTNVEDPTNPQLVVKRVDLQFSVMTSPNPSYIMIKFMEPLLSLKISYNLI